MTNYEAVASSALMESHLAPNAAELPSEKSDFLQASDLEEALPTLTQKLREMQQLLSPEEQAVLRSIVKSAATHLQSMDAVEINEKVRYFKPISAAASPAVRSNLIQLPKILGLEM